jgi:septal ring factor EnvC (AmiA/AmiB activator)
MIAFFLLALFTFQTSQAALDTSIQQYESSRSQALNAEEKKRSVLGELFEINRQLKDIRKDKAQIEKEFRSVTKNVKGITGLVGQVGKKIEDQKDRIRKRLRALYRFTHRGAAQVLLSSLNSATLDKNLRYLRILTDRDMALLREYSENVQVYNFQSKELEKEVERLARIKQKLVQKERLAHKKQKQKNDLMASAEATSLKAKARMRRLRIESKKSVSKKDVEQLRKLEALLRPSFFEKRGRLKKPIKARVSRRYGVKYDEKHRTAVRQKGHFYKAKKGSKVRSVYFGEVEYAAKLEGYGLTVIIDHGDHYYTVYSGLSSISVSANSTVEPGGVIGYSGRATMFNRDGLYFEIRYFSEPENPNKWLAKRG